MCVFVHVCVHNLCGYSGICICAVFVIMFGHRLRTESAGCLYVCAVWR